MASAIRTEDLWKRFHTCLGSFIQKRITNDNDADDILQEVFARIHANLRDLKNTESAQAWVFRITRNAISDHYSTRQRSAATLEDESALRQGEDEDEDYRSASAGLSRCMMLLMEELPDPYGEAVMLSELSTLSQKELSRRLGISISGMKSRVQRGRDRLKQLLQACCEIEKDPRGGIVGFTPRSASRREQCDCDDPQARA